VFRYGGRAPRGPRRWLGPCAASPGLDFPPGPPPPSLVCRGDPPRFPGAMAPHNGYPGDLRRRVPPTVNRAFSPRNRGLRAIAVLLVLLSITPEWRWLEWRLSRRRTSIFVLPAMDHRPPAQMSPTPLVSRELKFYATADAAVAAAATLVRSSLCWRLTVERRASANRVATQKRSLGGAVARLSPPHPAGT